MKIYAPCPDTPYAPVVGGLTKEEFGRFEGRLRAETPAIRFQKAVEKSIYPTLVRFTLKLYREDRERAQPIINEVVRSMRPRLSRIEREECNLAALVRQLARAQQADDQVSVCLMRADLCRGIEYLFRNLLERADREGVVDLWLDGMSTVEVTLSSPLAADVRGHIYMQGSEQPFEASIRAAAQGPTLDHFAARFGTREYLISTGVIRADFTESCQLGKAAFTLRVGNSVPHHVGDLIEWGFEVRKHQL